MVETLGSYLGIASARSPPLAMFPHTWVWIQEVVLGPSSAVSRRMQVRSSTAGARQIFNATRPQTRCAWPRLRGDFQAWPHLQPTWPRFDPCLRTAFRLTEGLPGAARAPGTRAEKPKRPSFRKGHRNPMNLCGLGPRLPIWPRTPKMVSLIPTLDRR